ncbi:MAG: site-2 protease family protein [Candidatus Bathyarchaeota archaeon]|nr:site-2 protease family protein [Candidatus Bathyarchaeota archaeon]
MKYSFRIGSVWGIPIELHLTFILLIAAVFIITFPELYWFSLILLLFAFVTVHELAHSFVARHYNINVRKIVLYPIGGVSEIEEIPQNPGIEWRLAIAGPLMSFLIAAVLFLLSQVVVVAVPEMALGGGSLSTAGTLLLDLATLNLLLGAFNLIPAFPMDGGRVLRALLAQRMNFSDATKYASYIGRILGIGMVFVGIVYPGYVLLIIVGAFIYIGASEEAEQTIVSTSLAQVRVRDVMCSNVATVTPQTTLSDAMETMFQARYHDAIVEENGVFKGIVLWEEIAKTLPNQRSQLTIQQLPLRAAFVYPNDSILEAQKTMTREKLAVLPVIDKQTQKVVCALTSEGLSAAYEKAKNPN